MTHRIDVTLPAEAAQRGAKVPGRRRLAWTPISRHLTSDLQRLNGTERIMTTEQAEEFVISRVLNAPRPLVFNCFTDVEHMKHWWGPKGVTIVKSSMDLCPGGTYHYGMRNRDGGIMWGRFVYREIVAPERIVLISSFSDENGGLARAPFFDGKWPLEMYSTFLFEEVDGNKTRFSVKWKPLNATAEEIETFASNFQSMNGGWTGTLEKFEAYLATVISQKE